MTTRGAKPMPGLTPRERDCLMVIVSFLKEHKRPPLRDELKTALCLKSNANITRLLAGLVRKGYITADRMPIDRRAVPLPLVIAAQEMFGELCALYSHVAEPYKDRARAKIERWEAIMKGAI